MLLLSSRGLARLWTIRNLPCPAAGGLLPGHVVLQDPATPCRVTDITERLDWRGLRIASLCPSFVCDRTLTSHHHCTPTPPPTFEKKFFYSVPCLFEYLVTLDCVVKVQHLLKVRGSVSGFSRGVSLHVSWVGLFCPWVSMWFPDERKEVQLPPLSQDDLCFCVFSVQHSIVQSVHQ